MSTQLKISVLKYSLANPVDRHHGNYFIGSHRFRTVKHIIPDSRVKSGLANNLATLRDEPGVTFGSADFVYTDRGNEYKISANVRIEVRNELRIFCGSTKYASAGQLKFLLGLLWMWKECEYPSWPFSNQSL